MTQFPASARRIAAALSDPATRDPAFGPVQVLALSAQGGSELVLAQQTSPADGQMRHFVAVGRPDGGRSWIVEVVRPVGHHVPVKGRPGAFTSGGVVEHGTAAVEAVIAGELAVLRPIEDFLWTVLWDTSPGSDPWPEYRRVQISGRWFDTVDPRIPLRLNGLAEAYVAANSGFPRLDSFWAWQYVNDLTERRPNSAWAVIRQALRQIRNAADRAVLAAGHLEDLVTDHAEAMVGIIEQAASEDPLIREALRYVWLDDAASPLAPLLAALNEGDPEDEVYG